MVSRWGRGTGSTARPKFARELSGAAEGNYIASFERRTDACIELSFTGAWDFSQAA